MVRDICRDGQRMIIRGMAYVYRQTLLASYETTRDLWHTAAINGHTNFSKVFLLSPAEGTLLADREIFTVSQLLEINDLTGRLTTDENRALFEELAIFPHLQHKPPLFVRVFRRGPIVDKLVSPVTAASSLFLVEKNLSQIFRRQL